jgi:hypothetical protein
MTKISSTKINEDFINELIEQDNENLALEKKHKLNPVLNIVESFLKKKQCVLYGGTALNMHLSKKNKFYSDTDIPDYDVYILDAKKNTFELAKDLKRKKFNFILIKNAIHSGTYKLSWHYNDISDFTDVFSYEYDIIKKNAKIINGHLVASIYLLKCNSYLELSMPKSCLFRWAKVYKRLSLLESENKKKASSLQNVVSNCFLLNVPNVIQTILFEIQTYVKLKKLPIAGFQAIKFFLNIDKQHLLLHKSDSLLQIISVNMEKTKKDILNILNYYTNDITYDIIECKKSSFFPNEIHIQIQYERKKYTVISIIDASYNCYGIYENTSPNGNPSYVSIFFIMYQLYFKLFCYENDKQTKKQSKLLLDIIPHLQNMMTKNKVNTLCYGYNETLSAKKMKNSKEGKPIVIYSSEKK